MDPKKRIGEMLVEAGIIDDTQLKAALGHQRKWGMRLGQALVDLKLATEADIVRALSLKFGFEVGKLDALEPYGHGQALKLFPREFVVRNNLFPMWADTANVTVAMSDPTNLAVVDEIRFRTGRRVKVCIAGDQEIGEAVKRHYPDGDGDVEAIALDLEADGDGELERDAVFDPFGGGSKDALEAFFGGNAAPSRSPPVPGAQAATPSASPAHNVKPSPARPWPETAPRSAPAARPPLAAFPAPGPRPAASAPAAAGAAPASAAPHAVARATPGRRLDVELHEDPAPRGMAGPASPAPAIEAEELALLVEYDGLQEEAILASELVPDDDLPEDATPSRELTAREVAILESLERLAEGAPAEAEVVKPAQAMAAMIRLLIRKRIVSEQDFLDEFSKK